MCKWTTLIMPFLAFATILLMTLHQGAGTSTSARYLRTVNVTRGRTSPIRSCFSNKTIIAAKVFQSRIVFAAKILNLTEIVVKRVVVTKSKQSTSPTPLNYYHYDYHQRKRRRETSVVQNITLGVGRALVKTVFKGDESLEGKIVGVTIEGGDGSKESRGMARCLRKLREGDTRIFFYSGIGVTSTNMGNQTSVPLPPALSVLAAVRTAVKGNPAHKT